jgi:hypothetical protein
MHAGFSFSYPPISLLLRQPLSIKKSYAGAIQYGTFNKLKKLIFLASGKPLKKKSGSIIGLGSRIQLYSLAETPQSPPPAFGLIYEGTIGQPRYTTSLCNPLGSVIEYRIRYGSKDPGSYQNVTDLEHRNTPKLKRTKIICGTSIQFADP